MRSHVVSVTAGAVAGMLGAVVVIYLMEEENRKKVSGKISELTKSLKEKATADEKVGCDCK